jgi:hypothetical protein
MAFPRRGVATPTAIGDLQIILSSPDPAKGEAQSARFLLQVKYDTGEVRELRGDLVPHLTGGQISQLQAFVNGLRMQAQNEILP